MKTNSKLHQIATVVYQMKTAAGLVENKVLARAIGTVIFDIPTTKSGLVSKALLCEYGYRPSVSKCTEEHFHSRNESGYALIDMMIRGASLDEVKSYLATVTQVHLTTKDENIRLSQIQNDPVTKDLPWQEQYAMVGIELVEDPGTMPRKLANQLKKEKCD